MAYSEDWIERYSRHIILTEVGGAGQQKFGEAKVLVLGAGGLGSPIALYLAAAGVGTLGLVDNDSVDLSNLQRQVLHHTPDIGRAKVESAAEKLTAINPDIKVVPYNLMVTSDNIMEIVRDYDIVVDGTDNFPTRFLVNDACVMAGKPLVHGAILRFDGQAFTILPHEGPCYRCIFREPPPPGAVPNCSQAGILGAVAGIIGTVQATEVLKIILGKGKLLNGRLLIVDALDMSFRETRIRKDPECPLCGENPTITELVDYEWVC
jgi:molybdopterin/thiamine biosynthesis adenylyltransferase